MLVVCVTICNDHYADTVVVFATSGFSFCVDCVNSLELACEKLELDLAVAARDHAQRHHLRVGDVDGLARDAADRHLLRVDTQRRASASGIDGAVYRQGGFHIRL